MMAVVRLLTVALGAATLLAGCVPILARTVYRPAAVGGKVTGDRYQPQTTIRFEIAGVGCSNRVFRRADGSWNLEIHFAIPAGTTVALAAPEIELAIDGESPRRLRISGLSGTGNPDLPTGPVTPMVGSRLVYQGHLISPRRNYWLFMPLDLAEASSFRLRLPALLINGRPSRVPEIRFTRDTDVRVLAPIQS